MRVTSGRDDDALSWDGDDDPTLDVGTAEAASAPPIDAGVEAPGRHPLDLPEGFTAVGKGSDEVGPATDTPHETEDETPVPETPALGNAALVGLGLIGGAYLLYTIGWIIGGLRLQGFALFVVSPAAYVPTFVLAVLAPAIWFATVYATTRHSRTWVRFAWLLAGIALLVPWPFTMVGAVGQ